MCISRKIFNLLFFVFIISYFPKPGMAEDKSTTKKQFVLKWLEIDGANKYQLIVKKSNGKVVVNQIVKENQIELFIPAGNYQIRIGAINIFGKVGSWSDWEKFTIKKTGKKKRVKYIPIGIRIQAGGLFNQIFSPWSDVYDNTYKAANVRIGYFFKNIPWLGFELDGTYFETKGNYSEIIGGDTDLKLTLIGGNFLFRTTYDFPAYFIVCAGIGFSNTTQSYTDYDYTNNLYSDEEVITRDYYAKIGCALEFSFLEFFFIGAGCDYYRVFYLGEQLKGLQYNLYLGSKF